VLADSRPSEFLGSKRLEEEWPGYSWRSLLSAGYLRSCCHWQRPEPTLVRPFPWLSAEECVDLCPCFAILGCYVTTTLITSKIIGDCVIGISCFPKFPSTTLTYFDNHPGSSSFLEEVQVPLNLAPSEVTTNSAGSGGKGTW
jgi:hypothetical protein